MRLAVRSLAEQVDPDGSDTKPLGGGKDQRRYHQQWKTVDGLIEYRGVGDPADGELMHATLDAFERPDPPGTPQRLHEAQSG